MALINMPTKLEEIQAQGVKQISCGKGHVVALLNTGIPLLMQLISPSHCCV